MREISADLPHGRKYNDDMICRGFSELELRQAASVFNFLEFTIHRFMIPCTSNVYAERECCAREWAICPIVTTMASTMSLGEIAPLTGILDSAIRPGEYHWATESMVRLHFYDVVGFWEHGTPFNSHSPHGLCLRRRIDYQKMIKSLPYSHRTDSSFEDTDTGPRNLLRWYKALEAEQGISDEHDDDEQSVEADHQMEDQDNNSDVQQDADEQFSTLFDDQGLLQHVENE